MRKDDSRQPGADVLASAMRAWSHPPAEDPRAIAEKLDALAVAARAGKPAFDAALLPSAGALLHYLLGFQLDGTTPEFTRTYVGDAFTRFLHTLDLLPFPVEGRALEIGSNPFFFHVLLRKLFPAAEVEGSNFFDRNVFSKEISRGSHRISNGLMGEEHVFDHVTFNLETVHPYPFEAGRFDLVLFCETFEHLAVDPLGVFRGLRRLLRPGGHLLVTLPNAVRLTNVAAMLSGRNFFDIFSVENGIHGRHNREYTLAEMVALLERDGFEVVRAETRDRFDYRSVPINAVDYAGPCAPLPFDPADLRSWIRKAGGSEEHRGDNLYLLARKPIVARRALRPAAERSGEWHRGRPRVADSDRFVLYVDECQATSGQLTLTGWAFLTDDVGLDAPPVFAVLDGPSGSFEVACDQMGRPDVAQRHGLENPEAGFRLNVSTAGLPQGRYDLLLRLDRPAGASVEKRLGVVVSLGSPGS